MPSIIRVLIVEEQKVICEGLKILLESASDIEVVGTVINSDTALSRLEELKPNILLMSRASSENSKFDVIEVIRQKYQQIKIIIFCNQVDASDFVQYLELGVNGCLLKDVSVSQIKEIIRYIHQGYTHIENSIFQAVLPELSDAVSALKIAESEFKESLAAPESAGINDDKFQLYPLGYRQNYQSENTATQSYIPLLDELTTDNSLRFDNSEPKTQKTWRQRGKTSLTLVGLGVAAIAGGIISWRQGAEIVINDAVVKGNIVSIDSPVAGELQKINYRQGMNIKANQLLANVETAEDSNTAKILSQLEKDIVLKREQINNEQKLLSFLENNLENLPRQSEITVNIPQSSEISQIFIDNSREIANLDQQIINQKVTINLFSKELSNLQDRLNETKANLVNRKLTPIKSPISGVVHKINYTEGGLIPSGQEIATLIDCQNLWVEAIIDAKLAAKINLQNQVSVHLEERESLIAGEINLIESLSNREQATNFQATRLASNKTNRNKIENSKESFYRLIIAVDFSASDLISQDSCNVGSTATITIDN